MMPIATKIKVRPTSWVVWFLLAYIIAALIWWFISLEKQNREMSQLQYKLALKEVSSVEQLQHTQIAIQIEQSRHQRKFIAEGITFLAVILAGGIFVISAVRKKLKLQQQQQDFMMAITHELKTPIAVTKLNLETLKKHQLDETRKNKIIQMTIDETNRLNALTNNILLSSQMEGDNFAVTKEELNLTDLVRSTLEDYRIRFPHRNWEHAIEDEIELEGDPLLLGILLNNLLENAMKYTPSSLPIRCTLQSTQQGIDLIVRDHGPGIPAGERQHIFEKFYRIGNESTRTSKGTGLGLYLCKKIVEDHHATIRVSNHEEGGAVFTVSFKK